MAKIIKNENIKITFLMLITNKDILIGNYAIKSYQMLYDKYYTILPFKLKIYANCFTEENKKKYFELWEQYSFVEIYDNTIKGETYTKGASIISPEGVERPIENDFELCDVIWTNELQIADTPYWATVDADMEILNPEFVIKMIEELDKDDNTIAMSVSYAPVRLQIWESYSKQYCNLHQRWCTWFCIYKQKAKECKISHFLYEWIDENGEVNIHDSCGYFQRHLIEKFGYTLKSLAKEYQNQYIHYGAFSKNKSINEKNIELYRKLAIMKQVGLNFESRIKPLDILINYISKIYAKCKLKKLFSKMITERYQYDFQLEKKYK